jgi:hypothetical protein
VLFQLVGKKGKAFYLLREMIEKEKKEQKKEIFGVSEWNGTSVLRYNPNF